jgi:heptosyltransferase-3
VTGDAVRAARRVLVVRTDSDGDVLLAGPAVRAVAAHASVTMLVSPAGEQAARLLPGVDEVVVFRAPWSGYRPPPVDAVAAADLVDRVRAGGFDAAVVLTSWHQSPLPAALLLRLAGVPCIAAASEDYPGSLLDLRFRADRSVPGQVHEVEAMLALVRAAGFEPDPAEPDPLRLAVRRPLPSLPLALSGSGPTGPFVVVHPGASVPSRAPAPLDAARIVAELAARGRQVVVTGSPGERELTAAVAAAGQALPIDERELTAAVAAAGALDLGGRSDLHTLAAVLEAAECVVVGNTGPAHLAAAVGTPVVSLFAPVVPLERWRPWGVPARVLGDQHAPCSGSGARECPVPGHPCLSIAPAVVADAVDELVARGSPPTAVADAVGEPAGSRPPAQQTPGRSVVSA